MPAKTARLQLPTGNFIGGRGAGTIVAIEPGAFQLADDRLPVAVAEMTITYENAAVFADNEAVWI